MTLVNTLISKDALTFATLQTNSPGAPVDTDAYIARDDESEAKRWEEYAGHSGVGEVSFDDVTNADDAAELFGNTAGA